MPTDESENSDNAAQKKLPEMRPRARWRWLRRRLSWVGLAVIVLSLVVASSRSALGSAVWLAIVGLALDIAGVMDLTSAVALADHDIVVRSGTYYGFNREMLRSMLEDRYAAQAGLALLIIGFLSQGLAYYFSAT